MNLCFSSGETETMCPNALPFWQVIDFDDSRPRPWQQVGGGLNHSKTNVSGPNPSELLTEGFVARMPET